MSFFSSTSHEEAMGTPKEREAQISNIISYLGLSTIGELIWVQRTLEKNFKKRLAGSNDADSNIYEQKKHEIEQLMTEHDSLLSKISNLEQEKDSTRKHANELKSELEHLSEDKKFIENERNYLSQELARVGKLFEEVTGKQAKDEDLQDILNIYLTLMEEVFSGRVHFKVLSIMHGEKMIWKRKELVTSTGFSEITIRKVLGELSRANLIVYDEEQATSKLVRRIVDLE
jgi:predicted RNase H-like nuclease (RuvC/YqgF family)